MTNVGDGNMVLVATMPVFTKDGRFIGILTGSIGLTQPGMLGNIAKTVIGKTGYLFITTADGKLIMHPDRKRLSQPAFRAEHERAVQASARRHRGHRIVARTATAARALASYRRVPTSNWIVAAVYPTDEAFRPVDAMVQRFVVFLLLACVVVLAAIWAMTRYVMRPLVSLTGHLASYGGSDVAHRPAARRHRHRRDPCAHRGIQPTDRAPARARGRAHRDDEALPAHHRELDRPHHQARPERYNPLRVAGGGSGARHSARGTRRTIDARARASGRLRSGSRLLPATRTASGRQERSCIAPATRTSTTSGSRRRSSG